MKTGEIMRLSARNIFGHEQSDMIKNKEIVQALRTRLFELTKRVAAINNELRKALPADLEEQAEDLEDQDALQAIENSELQEMYQIKQALKRISDGTFGVCTKCGADIDSRRLKALPTAITCISCAR